MRINVFLTRALCWMQRHFSSAVVRYCGQVAGVRKKGIPSQTRFGVEVGPGLDFHS
jgi:hypothetical protein